MIPNVSVFGCMKTRECHLITTLSKGFAANSYYFLIRENSFSSCRSLRYSKLQGQVLAKFCLPDLNYVLQERLKTKLPVLCRDNAGWQRCQQPRQERRPVVRWDLLTELCQVHTKRGNKQSTLWFPTPIPSPDISPACRACVFLSCTTQRWW